MTHGGAREGSGRRRSGPNSVQVNWRVSEKAKAWIIEQARIQNVSVAAIVDALIKHATVATVRAEDIRTPPQDLIITHWMENRKQSQACRIGYKG